MKFGVMLPHYRQVAGTDAIARVAREAENMGYDSVWVSDHIVVPDQDVERFGKGYYDPFSVLSYVAAITERISLGTSIVIIPECGNVKPSVLVPYPVLAGMHMQRPLYLYARHVTWDIQTVASCFVKRRDHPQEFTLILHLLRFCHLRRDYVLGNRGTCWLVVVRIRTSCNKYRYCEGCTQYGDEVLKHCPSAYSARILPMETRRHHADQEVEDQASD